MRNPNRPPAIERLIRRCLKNGIKTLGGSNNQLKPVVAAPRIVTYQGDRATFLVLLQYDAAHVDHHFDQGQNAEEFVALVEKVAQGMREAGELA